MSDAPRKLSDLHRGRILKAHNRGVLGFLRGTMKEPPVGKRQTVAAALRAGWHSAKAAYEASNQ